jgi:hypothetical protein
MGVITVVRLVIAVSLGAFGSLWLAYEMDVTNLVLNASALGFVMDSDELVYAVGMPPIVKMVVEACEPLVTPIRKDMAYHFLSRLRYKIGFSFVAVAISGVAAHLYLIANFIDANTAAMVKLNTTLCGGDTDFAYKSREDLGILLARTTSPFALNFSLPAQKRMMLAASQIWENTTTDRLAWMTPNQAVFETYAEMGVYSMTYNQGTGQATCDSLYLDKFDTNPAFAFAHKALMYHSGILTAEGCADLVPACMYRNQGFLRLTCPSQCGCADPLSGLYFQGPDMGCP